MSGTIHVVGGGLAGLSAAVSCLAQGRRVVLHEASPQCGGRCRSFYDSHLERVIDNGPHLLLGACRSLLRYVESIGGEDNLLPNRLDFELIDLVSKQRRRFRPSAGFFFRQLLRWRPRPSETDPLTLRPLLRLAFCRRSETLADCLGDSPPGLWDPLCRAVFNASPDETSAHLLRAVLRRFLSLSKPSPFVSFFAPHGLSAALVEPAVRQLQKHGGSVFFKTPLHHLEIKEKNVVSLQFRNHRIDLTSADRVILAVGPRMAHRLAPQTTPPLRTRGIATLHCRLPPHVDPSAFPLATGIVNGAAQWIFRRNDVLSVIVGACPDSSSAEVAAMVRDELKSLFPELSIWPFRYRLIEEKAAALVPTPEETAKRPGSLTSLRNLVLAGDWTATSLPSTLEGAVDSGQQAALLTLSRLGASGSEAAVR